MAAAHILLLDDDLARGATLARLLREAGHLVVPATEAAEAARALEVPGLDFFVLSLRIPGLDLPSLRLALAPSEPSLPDSLAEAERRHIARALHYTGGNKRRAAQLLGVARSTLLAKLRRYDLLGVGQSGPDRPPSGGGR